MLPDDLFSKLRAIAETQQRFQERITEPIRRINAVAKSYHSTLNQIVEAVKDIDFETIEQEAGWMELLAVPYLIELSKKGDLWKQLIRDFHDSEFLKEFRKDLGSKKVFDKRMHILNRAIDHHGSKDYVSSVPLLLAQIEGIIWDFGVEEKFLDAHENSRARVDTNGNPVLDKNGDPVKMQFGEVLSRVFGDHQQLQSHASEKVYSAELRNPVLHGRTVNYDDEKTSTMLMIFLTMLSIKAEEYQ